MSAGFLPYIGAFIWIGFLLQIGVILRAKIKILQDFLMPASLIGGMLGFILMRFDLIGLPMDGGYKPISEGAFAFITFHLFAFNFIGIGLIKGDKKNKDSSKAKIAKGAIWIAVMLTVTYALQTLVGIGIFGIWNAISPVDVPTITGALLAVGFTQGPGQAQSTGIIWETVFQVPNAVNVGFAFAATGFLVAGVMGTILARYLVKKGMTADKDNISLPNDFTSGIMDPENTRAYAMETTHNANINTLGYHFAVMLFLYGLAFLAAFAMEKFLKLEVIGLARYAGMAFGMLFLFSLIVSNLYKKFVTSINVAYLLDNGTTKALTGMCVDLLVWGVFLGIDIKALDSLIWPITIATIAGAISTGFVCIYYGKMLSEYGMERAMSLLGYATGTGANALLLLRIVDPNFKSPVLIEMGLVVLVQLFFFTPFVIFVKPIMPQLGVMNSSIILALVLVANLAIIYGIIYKQNKNIAAQSE